jgi:hypothetical protein
MTSALLQPELAMPLVPPFLLALALSTTPDDGVTLSSASALERPGLGFRYSLASSRGGTTAASLTAVGSIPLGLNVRLMAELGAGGPVDGSGPAAANFEGALGLRYSFPGTWLRPFVQFDARVLRAIFPEQRGGSEWGIGLGPRLGIEYVAARNLTFELGVASRLDVFPIRGPVLAVAVQGGATYHF